MSTGAAAFVGALIGREFKGSTVPLAGGALCCGLIALLFVLYAERGRLFRRHHVDPAVLDIARIKARTGYRVGGARIGYGS